MTFLNILILAVIQGLAELLPVSSSAHVIMAEKILGLDPSAPDMTLLLVMLHTGTMFAVIVHFWKSWRDTYFSSGAAFKRNALHIILATMMTGVVGLTLQHIIKVFYAGNASTFEIESLFSNSKLIASGLVAAGILIIVSSRIKESHATNLSPFQSLTIGIVQGLCLPFRGFSRSGATISTALSLGVARKTAEEFSFALAVVLTPVVIIKEVVRVFHDNAATHASLTLSSILLPSLMGMVFSFIAGLLALRWLAGWLEHGKWHLFGGYCIFAACVVLWIG
ncbi:undecaprenyl-diphosphate phosphatase [Rouxiella badensis]|jgi:undecaprenyl-diphosphatase|uniref:undecaprenyl-diphosphate phosphatase n=1 Tax=Rouxiella badensis TaxID=1646377 RepID=UPI0017888875|nr:undecaprenyl-diphosphate phosphatase [Rouxiella badensis]MCC3701854.1 undecaprenyl-diphosphate phosphatase [Rouxiella badensis]QOI55054.1 undecaprenyl-diphosphate phosphatase [Rouxiella badensis subsp. acadiensis]